MGSRDPRSQQLLSQGVHYWKLESEAEMGDSDPELDTGCGQPNWQLNCCTKCVPLYEADTNFATWKWGDFLTAKNVDTALDLGNVQRLKN